MPSSVCGQPSPLLDLRLKRINLMRFPTRKGLNLLVLFVVAWCTAGFGRASTIVPGVANPYLAGLPNGSSVGFDTAPAESPVQVEGLALSYGMTLTFSATGSTDYSGSSSPTTPPDGGAFFGASAPANNGIASVNAPRNSLIGVFLDSSLPTSSPAPSGLDFSVPGALSQNSYSPQLKQVFFIGDGLTGNGTGSVQQFAVPNGASRLFLGSGDQYGWYNNTGSFTVQVNGGANVATPEPATLWLTAGAFIGLLAFAKRGHLTTK